MITAATIAAICGFTFSPPASWDALPLPAGAQVVEIPWANMRATCGALGGRQVHFLYGCTNTQTLVAYVPTPDSWPGTPQCRDEVVRHEKSHLKGYVHP